MGVNLDYPTGKPDTAEYGERGSNSPRWHSLPVGGNNFSGRLHGNHGRSAILRRGVSFRLAVALRRCISNHGAGRGTVSLERAPRRATPARRLTCAGRKVVPKLVPEGRSD